MINIRSLLRIAASLGVDTGALLEGIEPNMFEQDSSGRRTSTVRGESSLARTTANRVWGPVPSTANPRRAHAPAGSRLRLECRTPPIG